VIRPPSTGRRFALSALALVLASPALASSGVVRRDSKGREIESWAGDPLLAPTSPWRGSTFAAGESLLLAWNAGDALADEPWIEEWEAFLSLDAGRSYRIRLTPHLDLAKRSFAVRLPDVASGEARLMFRMGNERRELEIELPWTFRIVAAERREAAFRNRAFVRGEAARGAEQGVISWVEGGRDGSAAREVATEAGTSGIRSVSASSDVALAALGPAPRQQRLPLCAPFSHPETEVAEGTETQAFDEAPARAVSPLQATCRRNE
jgi:hypothetical protein